MPYAEAQIYRNSITRLYSKYNDHLGDLWQTIKDYQEVAEMVAKEITVKRIKTIRMCNDCGANCKEALPEAINND